MLNFLIRRLAIALLTLLTRCAVPDEQPWRRLWRRCLVLCLAVVLRLLFAQR